MFIKCTNGTEYLGISEFSKHADGNQRLATTTDKDEGGVQVFVVLPRAFTVKLFRPLAKKSARVSFVLSG